MPVTGSAESDWHGSEPQGGFDDCGAINVSEGWHNIHCGEKNYFLCEKD